MNTSVNKITTWVCSGIADTLSCPILRGDSRKAIQIEAAGVNLSTASLLIQGITGATQLASVPVGTQEIVTVGGKNEFIVTRVTISNVPAGTYPVLFTPI